MAYEPTVWQGGKRPPALSPAALNKIEQGVKAAHDKAEQALADSGTYVTQDAIGTVVETPGGAQAKAAAAEAAAKTYAGTLAYGTDLEATEAVVAGFVADPSQVRAAGDARWVVKAEAPRNLLTYGADPTGVTDSTAAAIAFFKDLATHGGHGVARGTFRTNATIVVNALGGKPFTFDGEGACHFIGRNTAPESFFNLYDARNVTLRRFSVDAGHAQTGMSSHGIFGRDCHGCTVEDVAVTNWRNVGIGFYRTPTGSSSDNHIVRPWLDGLGAANNGVLLEGTDRGSIIDARAYRLGRNGSPGYGLQLKSNSTRCRIQGGWVEDAVGGVAFGIEGTVAPSMNYVTGVYAHNCKSGLFADGGSNNVIDMRIDMAAGDAANQAVRLQNGASGNDVRAQVDNVPTIRAAVRISGNDNRVHLTRVNGINRPKIYEILGTGSTRNHVRVGTVVGYTGTPFGNSTDEGTGNTAAYEGP